MLTGIIIAAIQVPDVGIPITCAGLVLLGLGVTE